MKNYQRNNRPLTGDGIQTLAPAVGVGMLDATICDIYLTNENGISINLEEWNCHMLPATLVTDMEKEYVSSTFE